VQARVRWLLATSSEEFLNGQPNISGDLPQQGGGDISSLVNRDRGDSPIWMLELLVRAPLPNLSEPESLKHGDDLARLEDGRLHGSRHGDGLYADELRLERGFAILKQEGNDFTQIGLQLVQRLRLAMGTGKARDIADVELCVGIPLNDGRVCGHGLNDTSRTPNVPAAT
jgi:hypothetical protein